MAFWLGLLRLLPCSLPRKPMLLHYFRQSSCFAEQDINFDPAQRVSYLFLVPEKSPTLCARAESVDNRTFQIVIWSSIPVTRSVTQSILLDRKTVGPIYCKTHSMNLASQFQTNSIQILTLPLPHRPD